MNCEECGRKLKDGEHCYGPQEYEGQVSPNWVLCIRCARNSKYDLINAGLEEDLK